MLICASETIEYVRGESKQQVKLPETQKILTLIHAGNFINTLVFLFHLRYFFSNCELAKTSQDSAL